MFVLSKKFLFLIIDRVKERKLDVTGLQGLGKCARGFEIVFSVP